MGATSIHVQAVKPGSEIHNFREKELDYVRPELSHLNESWVGDSMKRSLTNWTLSSANEPCMCYDEHKSYQGSFQQGKEQTP